MTITIRKKHVPVERYFRRDEDAAFFRTFSFAPETIEEFLSRELGGDFHAEGDELVFEVSDKTAAQRCREAVRRYYETYPVHVTRMFGSYVLLAGESGRLRAVRATPIPIRHCPLMKKLLTEVGGETAARLLAQVSASDGADQNELMCRLINEVVIDGGYFDTSRPLNSCEANVLFGASEILYSAFEAGLVDAAVIVSNNLGTIITTNASATQGAVKRMTGLFYTSPSAELMERCESAGILPVFPYTAEIDQVAGVRFAIEQGYKKIAVTLASLDNSLWPEIDRLERENGVHIYKFGLCSTGIPDETALYMQQYSDLVWSCASRAVKEHIEPNAIAQVGLRIPVYIMTADGWAIAKNHLRAALQADLDAVTPVRGADKPILTHSPEGITCIRKADIRGCVDCPDPCV